MDMCISQREELEIRPWELKGERLKRLRVKGEKLRVKGERLKRLRVKGERLRVKGERLWVRDNNRVASVLQNFNNL